MMKILEGGEGIRTPTFAPPFIKEGDRVIGMTSVVLLHLAPKLGLSPKVYNYYYHCYLFYSYL